jgi:pilus assembly protein Flp/PilA
LREFPRLFPRAVKGFGLLFRRFNPENYLGRVQVSLERRRYGRAGRIVRARPGDGDRGTSSNRGSLEMRRIIVDFIKDQTGATAIEYGLIAAGISIAIIVAVNGLGTTLNTTFGNVNSQLR